MFQANESDRTGGDFGVSRRGGVFVGRKVLRRLAGLGDLILEKVLGYLMWVVRSGKVEKRRVRVYEQLGQRVIAQWLHFARWLALGSVTGQHVEKPPLSPFHHHSKQHPGHQTF